MGGFSREMDESAAHKQIISWRWPGLWALNLPGLMLLWHALLARGTFVFAEEYQLATAAALGWLVLSAERWISMNMNRNFGAILEEQRATLFRLWAIVGGSVLLVATFRMTYWETLSVFLFIGIGGAYLLGLLRWRELLSRWISPELSLAVVTAAPAIFLVTANSALSPFRLFLPSLSLFILVFYYLALQCRWRRKESLSGFVPLLDSPAGSLCRTLAVGAVVLGGILGFAGLAVAGTHVLLAAALSAVLLAVLETKEKSLGADQCRRLADLALLTPLPPLIFAG